jgi:trigger factor
VPFDGGSGEDYELVLGSNSFIPGFEEKMNGMQLGEERDIDLTFPADYQQKDLAGKDVVFKVKLKELKEKILPELDDEFAKDVSEFDTLEEYKNSIREKKLAEKETEANAAFENAVINKIVEGMEIELPEAMIEDSVDSQYRNLSTQISQYGMDVDTYFKMMNTDAAGFRASVRPQAETSLKQMLALEKIAELEGIEPTDEEIESSYKETAEQYGAEIDDIKDQFERTTVVRDLKLRAAVKLVTEAAVKEAPPAETAVKETGKKTKKEAGGEAEAAAEKPAEKTPAKRTRKPKAAESAAAAESAEAAPAGAEEVEKAAEKPAAKKPAARKTAKSKETKSGEA